MIHRVQLLVASVLTLLSCGVMFLWVSSYAPLYSNRGNVHFLGNLTEGDSGWLYVAELRSGWLSTRCCRGYFSVEYLLALDDEIDTTTIPRISVLVYPESGPSSFRFRQRTRAADNIATHNAYLQRRVTAPLWIPAALLGAYPLWVGIGAFLRHPRVQPHLMPAYLSVAVDRIRQDRLWHRMTVGLSFPAIVLVSILAITASLVQSNCSIGRFRDRSYAAYWGDSGLKLTRMNWSSDFQVDKVTERPIGPVTIGVETKNYDKRLTSPNTLLTKRSVKFPRWLVLSTLSTYPLLLFVRERFRRWRRRRNGWCIECGYDLQGSDTPTCPECGKPV